MRISVLCVSVCVLSSMCVWRVAVCAYLTTNSYISSCPHCLWFTVTPTHSASSIISQGIPALMNNPVCHFRVWYLTWNGGVASICRYTLDLDRADALRRVVLWSWRSESRPLDLIYPPPPRPPRPRLCRGRHEQRHRPSPYNVSLPSQTTLPRHRPNTPRHMCVYFIIIIWG